MKVILDFGKDPSFRGNLRLQGEALTKEGALAFQIDVRVSVASGD